MKTLSILLLLAIVISCKPYRYLDKHHDEICAECMDEFVQSFDTVDVDTVLVTITESWYAPDSVLEEIYQLFFECNEENQVILKQIDSLQNNPLIKTKIIFKDGVLDLTAYTDSIKILNKEITYLHKEKTVKIVEKPIIIKKAPFWVWVVIGVMLLFIIFVFLVMILLKKGFKMGSAIGNLFSKT